MNESSPNLSVYDRLLAFLEELEARSVCYRLSKQRPDAIMVHVFAPGERWEVEFLQHGRVDVERFRSNGHLDDDSAFEVLWELSQDDVATLSDTKESE